MRVIAGTCKGRPLKTIKGTNTRPTTDKVKESIFNIIGPFFQGGNGLDLFGGSGGLGIEGLSRGLDRVIFVDKDPKAVETIHFNLKQCGFDDQAEVYRNDAFRAIKALEKRNLQFSIIFLDPPYLKLPLSSLIEAIANANLLLENGTIVVEHATKDELADSIAYLDRTRFEMYSNTISLSIYTYIRDEERS